jgi:hypothetical protein
MKICCSNNMTNSKLYRAEVILNAIIAVNFPHRLLTISHVILLISKQKTSDNQL